MLALKSNDPRSVIEELAADIGKRIYRGMMQATKAAEAEVVMEEPYREGNLRAGTVSSVKGSGATTVGTVKVTASYGPYVHDGTGVFGPYGQPIYPRMKKALAFTIGGRKIVRKKVWGQKPNPFVTRAKANLEKSEVLVLAFWRGFNAGE